MTRILLGIALVASTLTFAAGAADAKSCPPGKKHSHTGHCIWAGPNTHHSK